MTIQAEANTPYVIAEPDSIEPMTFGTGTPFKDPGFNEANTLKNNWKVFRGDGEVKKMLTVIMSLVQKKKEPKSNKTSIFLNEENIVCI